MVPQAGFPLSILLRLRFPGTPRILLPGQKSPRPAKRGRRRKRV